MLHVRVFFFRGRAPVIGQPATKHTCEHAPLRQLSGGLWGGGAGPLESVAPRNRFLLHACTFGQHPAQLSVDGLQTCSLWLIRVANVGVPICCLLALVPNKQSIQTSDVAA